MKIHKSIKIEQHLIDKINTQAEKQNRSFNNMVEVILSNHLIDEDSYIITTTIHGDNGVILDIKQ